MMSVHLRLIFLNGTGQVIRYTFIHVDIEKDQYLIFIALQ